MYDYFSLRMPMYFEEDAGGSGGEVEIAEKVVDKDTEEAIGDLLEFAVGKEDLPEVKIGEDGKPLVVEKATPLVETHKDVDPADLIEKVDIKEVEKKLKAEESENEAKEKQAAEKAAEEKTKSKKDVSSKEKETEDGEGEVVTLTEELIESYGLDESYKVGEKVRLETEEEPEVITPEATEQNQGLLKEIERLSSIMQLNGIQTEGKEKTVEKKEEGKEKQAQTDIQDLTPVDFNIVTEENFTATTGTPEGMNKFGEEIAGKVAQAILPLMVVNMRNLIPKYVEIQSGVEKFFVENKDLAGVRQYTAQVMNQIRAEHPEVTDINELLEKSAKKVREKLKLAATPQKVVVEETTLRTVKKKKSAQPGQKKVQRRKVVKEPVVKGKPTEQGAQMDEILDFALDESN